MQQNSVNIAYFDTSIFYFKLFIINNILFLMSDEREKTLKDIRTKALQETEKLATQ